MSYKEHTRYDAADLDLIMSNAERLNIRQDADGIFLARLLDYVKTRIYDVNQTPLRGLQLVPMSTEVPETAESFTYRIWDMVGMAIFISNYADDLPRVDVTGEEKTSKLKSLGDAYGYNFDEMRTAQALGVALSERKGRAARRAIDELINKTCLVGDEKHGFYGITNHPNIGETVINGNWTDPATTGLQVLDDLFAMYDAVRIQSKGYHLPNTLGVAPTRQTVLNRKSVNGENGNFESVWTRFRAQYPNVQVIDAYEMEPSAQGADDSIAIMYERDIDNLSIEVPRPFEQLPAEKRGLEMVIDCISKISGVILYRPLSITKGVGV